MLLASWHSLRLSTHLARRRLVTGSQLHTVTLQSGDLFQNVRQSQRHNYSVGSGPSDSNSTTFPIDVLDAQSSFRTFCDLVEEDRLDEAKMVMRDVVEAAPTLAVMNQFKQVLQEAPEKTGPLMVDLAYFCALKGEQQLVRDHLLPILRNVMDSGALQELDTLLQSPSASLQTDNSDSVFEDLSSDYALARNFTATLKPSVMDLVQTKLPALLPEITTSDSAIFEEDEQEYGFAAQPEALTQSNVSASSFLAHLVQQKQFGKAYDLLRELQHLGTTIPKSPAYETAIIASISSSKLSSEEQYSRVLAWLPLLPDRISEDPYKILPIFRLLTRVPKINLKLLADSATVMSGKGYAKPLAFDVVPTIIRFSSLEFGQEFIKSFIEVHSQFSNTSSHADSVHEMEERVYSSAVQTLARARREEDAYALFETATAASVQISANSLKVLVSRLKKSGNSQLISKIMVLQLEGDMQEASVQAKLQLTSDLRDDLRLMKRGVLVQALPVPNEIAQFMNNYVSAGRNLGLTLLLQKAFRNGFFSSNILLFAEMMLYQRAEQHALVLETFVEHFYLTGIPREEVLTQHRRTLRQRQQQDTSSLDHYRRIVDQRRLTQPHGKLWPTVDHCDLVWIALANLTESDKDLEKLYMKLLRYASTGTDAFSDPEDPSTTPLLPPLPHGAKQPHASHIAFTPFIRRMMHAFGEERGVKILRDMVQLGLQPTAYHYTELAAFYSSSGMVDKTFLVLGYMMGNPNSPDSTPSTDTPSSDGTSIYDFLASQSQRNAVPKPDLVSYTAIIRGFIKSRQVEAATEAARSLAMVHKYVPGHDSYLDAALLQLHELIEEGDAWVPKPY